MIRSATPADVEALCSLLRQLGYEANPDQVTQSLAQPHLTSVYVYDLAEQVVGFVALVSVPYFPTQQTLLRITALCVDHHYRGQGIGGDLVRHVTTLAADWGYGTVEVTCSVARQAAHRFYQGQGFEHQGYRYVQPVGKPSGG